MNQFTREELLILRSLCRDAATITEIVESRTHGVDVSPRKIQIAVMENKIGLAIVQGDEEEAARQKAKAAAPKGPILESAPHKKGPDGQTFNPPTGKKKKA